MTFENQYSWLDRVVHQIAFKSYPLQTALADIENTLFASRFRAIEVKSPVFITALPRAGTTLLLETISSADRFAVHNYRDMPFVLIPFLWDKISGNFRTTTVPKERAHCDGMLVNLDSPEAFEEIIWKVFWKEHYQKDCILPWGEESNPEFEPFFKEHIRKLIALRYGSNTVGCRYISKNNLNIARLDLIENIFSDARIVIPFRNPLQHSASLLKQHKNFLALHRKDQFARRYMEGIGHFDFGENLRPVNFNHWLHNCAYRDPLTIEYWLSYWAATYSFLLKRIKNRIFLVDYDHLIQSPAVLLESLAEFLNLSEVASLVDKGSHIKPGRIHPVDTKSIPQGLHEQFSSVYADLQDLALKQA